MTLSKLIFKPKECLYCHKIIDDSGFIKQLVKLYSIIGSQIYCNHCKKKLDKILPIKLISYGGIALIITWHIGIYLLGGYWAILSILLGLLIVLYIFIGIINSPYKVFEK